MHVLSEWWRSFSHSVLSEWWRSVSHSVAYAEIQEAMSKLEKAKTEGRLEEYLHQSPNLLYALLTHPKMTPDMVNSVLVDLFIAGVESVWNVEVTKKSAGSCK